MPQKFCICTGCPACPPSRRSHMFDADSSPGHQRCGPCQAVTDNARWSRRGTTSQRGYGTDHNKARAEAAAAFVSGTPCARCGDPIGSVDQADLDHDDSRDGTYRDGTYLGWSHSSCNRRAGAQSRSRRRPVPVPRPQPVTDGDDDNEWPLIIA